MKGSYHRRKANNKPDVIFVPNPKEADTFLIDKQTLINLVQVAYETGFRQGETRVSRIIECFGEEMVNRALGHKQKPEGG